MEKKEKKEFLKILVMLATGLNVELTPPRQEFYWLALKGMVFDDFKRAAEVLATTWKVANTFPLPAHFMDASQARIEDQAELAWAEAIGAVRQIGPCHSVNFDDLATHAAIMALGGWERFADIEKKETPFIKKDFIALYKAYANKQKEGFHLDAPSYLIGEFEKNNRSKGYDKAWFELNGLEYLLSDCGLRPVQISGIARKSIGSEKRKEIGRKQ